MLISEHADRGLLVHISKVIDGLRVLCSVHVLVDESKPNGYYVAAAVVAPAIVTSARSVIGGLRHKGPDRSTSKTKATPTAACYSGVPLKPG